MSCIRCHSNPSRLTIHPFISHHHSVHLQRSKLYGYPLSYSNQANGHQQEPSTSSGHLRNRTRLAQYILATGSGGALLLWFNLNHQSSIKNEEFKIIPSDGVIKPKNPSSSKSYSRSLENGIYLWGSNRNGLVAPGSDVEVVKKPTPLPFFEAEALRDLVLHEKYAVAVDGRGDIYTWGSETIATEGPKSLLRHHDIKQVCCTSNKIYALSRAGQLFVLPIGVDHQSPSQSSGSRSSHLSWWPWWLGGSSQSPPISLSINPQDNPLTWRERFTSISAGDHHLLAITSNGRTFATPVDLQANSHGQLGVKQVKLMKTTQESFTVPLTPTALSNAESDKSSNRELPRQLAWLADKPLSEKQSGIHDITNGSLTPSPDSVHLPSDLVPENAPDFCSTLHEVPALRNVKVVEVACGSRHSLFRTGAGDVLGLGANQFGQLGAGTNLLFPALLAPTEVDLPRSRDSSITCIGLAAGGDVSYLVTEKQDIKYGRKAIEVLAAGHGQYGGVGNGQWTHQASPVKVKTISGLLEWSEKAQTVFPIKIHHISVGKTHVAAVLDNAVSSGGKDFGRDVFLWGHNADCQLGNQKRANLAVPQHISPLPRPELQNPSLREVTETIESGTSSPMPHNRLQLSPKKRIARHDAEETVTAGWGTTAVYWRLLG